MNPVREARDPASVGEFTDELRPGTELLHGQYRIERFLNAGGFGITYLARDSLDRIVVIKECYPSSICCRTRTLVRARSRSHQEEYRAIVRLFGQEARRLAQLQHPNIVGIHQVFEDNDTAYMALDFVRGHDLLDVIEDENHHLEPREIRELLCKLLKAVAFIHDRDILHRDISPDNILLDQSGNPVLIDFGAARERATRASRVLSAVLVVKDGYSPQEFYIAGGEQQKSSDLYSLAATFYHIITGEAPPQSQIRLAAIAANRPDPCVPLEGRIHGYDRHFLSALDKAMSVFPQDRYQTAMDWYDAIHEERRVRAALEKARQDKAIEKSIVALVQETNKAVLEEQEKAVEAPKPEETLKPRSRPLPKFPELSEPIEEDEPEDDTPAETDGAPMHGDIQTAELPPRGIMSRILRACFGSSARTYQR